MSTDSVHSTGLVALLREHKIRWDWDGEVRCDCGTLAGSQPPNSARAHTIHLADVIEREYIAPRVAGALTEYRREEHRRRFGDTFASGGMLTTDGDPT